jgi:hypothetical protein
VSLKLVELQLALPRTYDMGKVQEQIQQQSQVLQAQLAMSMQKKEEEARHQVTKKEKSFEVRWEKENSSPLLYKDKNKKGEKQRHPYKGKIIDYTG